MSGSGALRRDRFNDDTFSQLGADAQAGVADLADEVGLAAEQGDFLLFAKAHLAQPVHHFLRGAKLFDTYTGAGPHLVERAKLRLGTIAFHRNRH